MIRKSLLVAGAIIALAGVALAQGVVQNTLTGNESWNAGQGPGGPGSYITSNMVRNSATNVLTTIASAKTLAAPLNFGGNLIITAQPSGAAVITLPANPIPDGTVIGLCNGTASAFATTVVTAAANTNQTLVGTLALTTLAASTCLKVQFHLATTTWYRIQ